MSNLAIPAYAQDVIKLTPQGTDWGGVTKLTLPGIVSGAISLVMLAVALAFFFMLLIGGFRWVTSQGDQKNVEAARNSITNALIGLAIVFAAWAIMKLIETVFGISIISGMKIPTF